MNTIGVQALSHRLSHGHVFLGSVRGGDAEGDLDMHGGDDLRVGQLPDVDVVAGDDARDGLDVLLDVVDVEVIRSGLEENLGGCGGKWDGGLENDQGDEEGDCWVGVETLWRMGEPDNEGGNNDTDVAEGVTYNVENHAVHSQITVRSEERRVGKECPV